MRARHYETRPPIRHIPTSTHPREHVQTCTQQLPLKLFAGVETTTPYLGIRPHPQYMKKGKNRGFRSLAHCYISCPAQGPPFLMVRKSGAAKAPIPVLPVCPLALNRVLQKSTEVENKGPRASPPSRPIVEFSYATRTN